MQWLSKRPGAGEGKVDAWGKLLPKTLCREKGAVLVPGFPREVLNGIPAPPGSASHSHLALFHRQPGRICSARPC